ncbi:MAG: flagellar export chaperone FliS [Phycisphaerae bacterium]|nr:flagellar export chaperone FliS [Phycisphaerae bacterium]
MTVKSGRRTPEKSGVDTNPANAYLRTRVLTASPAELRLMLLDGALKFARQGREGLASKNYEAMFNGISQCRNIVLELLTTVRPEAAPELCKNVKAVYTFLYTRLVEASMERSIEKLDESIRLLEYERETWAMLMEQMAAEQAGQRPEPAPGPVTPARTSISVDA